MPFLGTVPCAKNAARQLARDFLSQNGIVTIVGGITFRKEIRTFDLELNDIL